MRGFSLVALVAAAVTASGCSGSSEKSTGPRPASPLIVSVALTPKSVTITPRVMTAGQVLFTITNQSGEPRHLQISSDPYGSAKPYDETTDLIGTGHTSNFSTTLSTGTYELSTTEGGLTPINLVIGKDRENSDGELLIP